MKSKRNKLLLTYSLYLYRINGVNIHIYILYYIINYLQNVYLIGELALLYSSYIV